MTEESLSLELVTQPVISSESEAKTEKQSSTTIITEENSENLDQTAELLVTENNSNEEISTENRDKEDQDQNMELDEIPQQSYWNYEIPQNFRPCNHLAITPSMLSKPEVGPQPSSRKKKLNFFKGCKWAPDGSCLISNSDDDILRLYNVPETLYGTSDWTTYQQERSESVPSIESVLQIKEGGQVYDYCWYPRMSSWDPVTCCFITTTSDAPVHLWDAGSTGKLRASYLAYDHLDQVVAARSVAFDPTGQSIICGFDTLLRTFDLTRPGRDCVERKLKHLQITELSQPGIVSCIGINPSLTSVMAVGSYLKTVGLYHEDGNVLCILQGHAGGVTHLQFSLDGSKLFSGGRKDSRIICWDLRWMGEKYTIYDRVVETNQRIYFDITPNGRYLLTGGTDGRVKIWDVNSGGEEPISSFQANADCVNGVSINPFIPLLATSSGQRHMHKLKHFSSDDEDDEDTSDSESAKIPQVEERDIKLWKLC